MNLFDVTMGSYDGAEICELVGAYLLSQMIELGINVGLYRDDGLMCTNKSPKECEKVKKQLCKLFSDNDLKITIEANTKVVDYLDVTFNLSTGLHKPFMKPDTIV